MNIDEVTLNFNPTSLLALDVVIALIMFGIALAVKVQDFTAVLRMPKAITVAIAAQFVLLPAVTFGLTFLLGVGPSIALGMILVACCPPGNISQVLTNQARGNVALSVSMTAVGNLLAIFLMPINFAFWGGLHPTASKILEVVELDAFDMLVKIVAIIGVPFALGILIGNRWPNFTAKVQPWVRRISLVALHDAVALALGWASARVTGLDAASTKAVTFEVGIRNAGLGLGLVFAFFDGLGGMAIVAGWWGIWDIVAGLALATFWARRSARKKEGELR